MKTDNKLKGRDLINIGIYAAIYFVILFAVAMLGMIPIFLPLLSVNSPKVRTPQSTMNFIKLSL